MAKDQTENITLNIKEVNALLCPKCQLVLKKLVAEKIAEKVMKE